MNKFLLGVKALILKEGKILLVKRGSTAPTFPLTWDLPGGLVDDNELPDDAVLREVQEETGLEVENSALMSNTIFERKGEPALALFYILDYKSGEVKLSYEHEGYKWVAFQDLAKEELQPWIKKHLEVAIEKYTKPIP
ncbi:MAG: NUDIX domain-containing protein [Candidatus Dojkabacteria bacterium]